MWNPFHSNSNKLDSLVGQLAADATQDNLHSSHHHIGQKHHHSQTTFQKLQSTIVLFVFLGFLLFIAFLCYQVYASITERTREELERRQIRINSDSDGLTTGGARVSIPIKYMSPDKVGTYMQRFATKVVGSAGVVDENEAPVEIKVPRYLKFREWKDRKRRIYEGSATEAANHGFYQTKKGWEGEAFGDCDREKKDDMFIVDQDEVVVAGDGDGIATSTHLDGGFEEYVQGGGDGVEEEYEYDEDLPPDVDIRYVRSTPRSEGKIRHLKGKLKSKFISGRKEDLSDSSSGESVSVKHRFSIHRRAD